ncbi:MAG: hypothetical protein E7378_03660 [Clostridiales bacterium]|nr:hypothetical protein [Clostridiales bacterium]
MKLNNSLKLSVANFALFWKLLLYKTIVIGIGILLFLPISKAVISAFEVGGLVDIIKQLFSAPVLQNLTQLSTLVLNVFSAIFASLAVLASTNVFALVWLMLLLFLIIPFLSKLSDVPASESVYSYMSSLNKKGFAINFVSMLGKSLQYSILKTLIELPFVALILLGVYGIATLSTISFSLAVFAPFLSFVFVVLMLSLNITIFSGWSPSVVVFNQRPCKAIKKGIKAVNRNFASTLSSFVVMLTILIGLTYLFGIYALFLVVPLMALVIAVFGQVLFFESQGMDYYISLDKIIKPRKLETADKIKKARYII